MRCRRLRHDVPGQPRRAGLAIAVASLLAAGAAHGSHNGPTRAEVPGFDARTQRLYFAQFDESEVAHAPRAFYFDLGGRRPASAISVPGPVYDGDAGTADFVLGLHAEQLPDSVSESDPDQRAPRFALTGTLRSRGLRGDFQGVGFFDSWAGKVSAWRFPRIEPRIVVVAWQGVWIGSADEDETCVLLLPEKPPARGARR